MQKRGRKPTKQSPQKQPKSSLNTSLADDYCFVCKDGGLLIVCDHKECGKSYHPRCAGKEESTEEEDESQWICAWHNCLVCKKSSKYQCFCCPNAVCQSCFKDAVFAKTRGNKGFCSNCLKLAMLYEEDLEYDSDGAKVDFKDRDTYEGLFKEYWDIIKENEGLTLEDLHYTDIQIKKGEHAKRYLSYKKGENPKHQSKKADSNLDDYNTNKEEENKELSDDHAIDVDGGSSGEDEVVVQPVIVKTKKRPRKSKAKEKPKFSKIIEFLGWASKPLIEFLGSIGVDTAQKLPQSAVASLIHKYAQDNKLFNPDKKKVILCDLRLQSAFGRKSFSVYKINDVIEPHLAENIDQSEDEGYSSGYEEENTSVPTKKEGWWKKTGSFQNKGPLLEKFQQKEAILEEPIEKEPPVKIEYSPFATIIPKNMKLVYLRKSLVEQLLGQYDTFESKVVGSFVKVKCDLDPKCPYQLLPVTGITKSSDSGMRKVLLQISNLPNDVSINMLSNDDLSEVDCENLRKNVENGLVEKPTVVKLEKKAKILHEDITKHWIAKELSILRYRIDLANEKGRRAELYEYRRRRDLLQSEEEQSRLLNEAPYIIADVIEVKTASEDIQLGDTPEKADSVFNPDMASVTGKITA